MLAAVEQAHAEPGAALDHVVVREHVAVGRDDHARAERRHGVATPVAGALEELAEEVAHRAGRGRHADADQLLRRDVHDRAAHALDRGDDRGAAVRGGALVGAGERAAPLGRGGGAGLRAGRRGQRGGGERGEEGEATASGSASPSASSMSSSSTSMLLHRRLDRERAVGEIGERADVLLPVLLVDDPLAQVALRDALVDVLVLGGIGHEHLALALEGAVSCPGLRVRQARATARAHAGIRRLARARASPGSPASRHRGRFDPVAAAIAGGARAVQPVLKDAPSGVLEAARRIVALAAGHAFGDRIPRRPRAFAGADGVHLGDEDLPPAEARRLLGLDLLVGRTCRTLDEARAAIAAGPIVGFGPIFGSRSKALAVRRAASRRSRR